MFIRRIAVEETRIEYKGYTYMPEIDRGITHLVRKPDGGSLTVDFNHSRLMDADDFHQWIQLGCPSRVEIGINRDGATFPLDWTDLERAMEQYENEGRLLWQIEKKAKDAAEASDGKPADDSRFDDEGYYLSQAAE